MTIYHLGHYQHSFHRSQMDILLDVIETRTRTHKHEALSARVYITI